MSKNSLNFWVDTLIFIAFVFVVFTGIVLREFPAGLSGVMVLGLPREELADLHWVLALSMILLIFVHLIVHWGWAKVRFKKHLHVGPRALAITAIVLVAISMIVAPLYLTRDLPSRKAVNPRDSIKETPSRSWSFEGGDFEEPLRAVRAKRLGREGQSSSWWYEMGKDFKKGQKLTTRAVVSCAYKPIHLTCPYLYRKITCGWSRSVAQSVC